MLFYSLMMSAFFAPICIYSSSGEKCVNSNGMQRKTDLMCAAAGEITQLEFRQTDRWLFSFM